MLRSAAQSIKNHPCPEHTVGVGPDKFLSTLKSCTLLGKGNKTAQYLGGCRHYNGALLRRRNPPSMKKHEKASLRQIAKC